MLTPRDYNGFCLFKQNEIISVCSQLSSLSVRKLKKEGLSSVRTVCAMNRTSVAVVLISLFAGISVGYTFSYREIAGLQLKVTTLESKFSTLTTDYYNLNTKYNRCMSDYEALNSSHYELQETYELLTEYYISLNSIYSELQGDYEEAQGRIAELEQMIEY